MRNGKAFALLPSLFTEKTVSAEEFLKLPLIDRAEARIVSPRLGEKGFGGFIVRDRGIRKFGL